MTRDDIIKLAQEAGFDPHDMSNDFTCNLRDIERFAALVAAAEREECATEADYASRCSYAPEPCEEIAKAIRARGQA